ncbi:hypothetical protein KFK09_003941 [Dendrobium nobile]|uniref:Uncharacterized protein n=1 Tax=Dendrobium nobile TaxID=94219 RepID=A0A8T3C1J9_DENNO|nr:hypothetical protein KFK09_003941 [Dendrobium nobile]
MSIPLQQTHPMLVHRTNPDNKPGHIAAQCWHRTNLSYVPPPPWAMLTHDSFATQTDWVLDTGATSHLTFDAGNLE